MWWWDGAQWRAAFTPDGRLRWDGQAWVPAPAPQSTPGISRTSAAITIAVIVIGGIFVMLAILVVAVLYEITFGG